MNTQVYNKIGDLLTELKRQRDILDIVINKLQEMNEPYSTSVMATAIAGQLCRRRGRKAGTMSREERIDISSRMKAYWAKHRKEG